VRRVRGRRRAGGGVQGLDDGLAARLVHEVGGVAGDVPAEDLLPADLLLLAFPVRVGGESICLSIYLSIYRSIDRSIDRDK
jgi:hypothetical protein